jgi:hypothetical protein
MFTMMPIKGVSIGLEYFDREDLGFGINADLGVLRVTWYKDVRIIEDEDDEL